MKSLYVFSMFPNWRWYLMQYDTMDMNDVIKTAVKKEPLSATTLAS